MNLPPKRIAVLVVALHVVVIIGHALAHYELGVMTSPARATLIVLVIFIAPVAAVMVWSWKARLGAWVLATSMAAAALVAAPVKGRDTGAP